MTGLEYPESNVGTTKEDRSSRLAWRLPCDDCDRLVTEDELERCGCDKWRASR